MLNEVLAALAPAEGETYVDGTFGAGGYTQAILDAAPCQVVAIDRDPSAIAAGEGLVQRYDGRLTLVEGRFGDLARHAADLHLVAVQGVVLDIGVSSMQLDQAARGFSFQRPGPLDMRMSQVGVSAADVVNGASVELLANIIFLLGDETRSRGIAKAIVAQRAIAPILTTDDLVRAVEKATGPQRAKERIHPATRTFQALRIYVNGELDQLVDALHGAEQVLAEGGRLVVVTFHSLEDRIVKRFLAARAGKMAEVSRYLPGTAAVTPPSFELLHKGHVSPSAEEEDANPRARSAKLRAARRTAAPPWPATRQGLGIPTVERSTH
jgi:16S rRNA (cytosine1402-N4)-methyltransferase